MRIVKVATLTLTASAVLLLLALTARAEQFSNFALTTLATSIGAGDTSLTVAATTNFPNTAPFRIVIQDSAASTPEIDYVTAVAGNVYTVTRGYEGTTATSHSAGAQVAQFVTAGVITDIYSKLSGVQPAGTNGQIQFNNNGTYGGFTASGDCLITASTGVITCAKTAGSPFVASATTDTTNAANITSGTLPAARLPNPSATTLGGIQSFASASHRWINGISTSGVPASTQPACADLSDSSPSCSTDTTNASNIASGTLGAARLPAPSATTLGGVQSFASASHQWINSISTSGVPSASQPDASDLTGLAASATTDATNASNIASGTLPSARLGVLNASSVFVNSICSAAPTTCGSFFGYSDIRWYGANCNGGGDDGGALQNAANAANTGGWKRVFVPYAKCNIVTGFSNPGNGVVLFSVPQHVFYDPTTVDGGQIYFNTGYSGFVTKNGAAMDMNGHNLVLENINFSGDGAQAGIPTIADSVTYTSGPLPELNMTNVSFTRMGTGIGCAMNNVNVTPGSNSAGACIGSLQGNLITIRGNHVIFSQNGWAINVNSSDMFLDVTSQIAGNACGGIMTTNNSADGEIHARFDQNGGGASGMCSTASWASLTLNGHGFNVFSQFELANGPGLVYGGSHHDNHVIGHFSDNGQAHTASHNSNILFAGSTAGNSNEYINAAFFTFGFAPGYNVDWEGTTDNHVKLEGSMATNSYTSGSDNFGTETPTDYTINAINKPLTTNGDFVVTGTTSGAITFHPQAAAGAYTWPLPTSIGSAGTVLTSQGGSSPMTWTNPNGTVIAAAVNPTSMYPNDTSGSLFPSFYSGAGGNASPVDYGMGVVASLTSDKTWELRFPIPSGVPTGTMKLRILGLANATSGVAKFTVNDAVVGAGASPSAATLTAETQSTVTWAAGDNDKYKETKVTLTPSASANGMLVVALTFNTSGFTLAQNSTWIATLIFE